MLEGTNQSISLHRLWLDADHTPARTLNTDLIRMNPASRPSPVTLPPPNLMSEPSLTGICNHSQHKPILPHQSTVLLTRHAPLSTADRTQARTHARRHAGTHAHTHTDLMQSNLYSFTLSLECTEFEHNGLHTYTTSKPHNTKATCTHGRTQLWPPPSTAAK